MFGKNNQKMAQFRHADQRQRFAVRKLGIRVVSVLVGAVLAGGGRRRYHGNGRHGPGVAGGDYG